MNSSARRVIVLIAMSGCLLLSGCYALSELDQWELPSRDSEADTGTAAGIDTSNPNPDTDSDTDSESAVDSDSDTAPVPPEVVSPYTPCGQTDGRIRSHVDLDTGSDHYHDIVWPSLPEVDTDSVVYALDEAEFETASADTHKWIVVSANLGPVEIWGSHIKVTFADDTVRVDSLAVRAGANHVSISGGRTDLLFVESLPEPQSDSEWASDITVSCMDIGATGLTSVQFGGHRIALLNNNIEGIAQGIKVLALSGSDVRDVIIANNLIDVTSSSHTVDMEHVNRGVIQENVIIHRHESSEQAVQISYTNDKVVVKNNLIIDGGVGLADTKEPHESCLLQDVVFAHNVLYYPDEFPLPPPVIANDEIGNLKLTDNIAYTHYILEDDTDSNPWEMTGVDVYPPSLWDTDIYQRQP